MYIDFLSHYLDGNTLKISAVFLYSLPWGARETTVESKSDNINFIET